MKHAVKELLAFCDFLALRLHTENVEILRRVVTEFYETPRALHTVETLLATGFPAMSILPVGNETHRARGLLKRHGPADPPLRSALRDIYDVLHTKIQVTNWQWLLRMYEDFCNGLETTVDAFVAHRPAAIAMFPIAPRVGNATVDTDDVKYKDEKIEVQDSPPSPQSMGETSDEDDLEDLVRRAQLLIERKTPWERIFDVARIEYPFDDDAYPGLARNLLSFWEDHAQAVWERHFWAPFPETDDPDSAFYERKKRQSDAAACFTRKVMVPVFATFGAQFFIDLDAHGTEAYWWWYRRPVVNLLRMARTMGVDECVRYTKRQSRKRIPTLPPTFQVSTRGVWHESPVSMWATTLKVRHISDAIEAHLKAAKKAKKAMKRRRDWDQ